MPVTARLSQKFYDRFGDDATNELVEWFNAVDSTYRTDLLRMNDSNFARFDAKLEQRFAESDAKWEKRFAEFEARQSRLIDKSTYSTIRWFIGLWVTGLIGNGVLLQLLAR